MRAEGVMFTVVYPVPIKLYHILNICLLSIFPNYIKHWGGVEQRMVSLGKYVEVIPRSLYIQKWQQKVKKDSEESPVIKHTHSTSVYIPVHIHKHNLGKTKWKGKGIPIY